MTRHAIPLPMVLALLAGCAGTPQPPERPPPLPPGLEHSSRQPANRPKRPDDPLAQRASFAFHDAPFPEVIGALARQHRLVIAVSRSIPFERWAKHRVTLRMADVSRRAFLDWLARPLGAQYAADEKGEVWLARDDELLETEPLDVRTCSVPTHVRASKPIQGTLSFAREQALVIDTLEAGLRYLLDRRRGCRLAFHGEQDILVARLPARGHRRLTELLDAMRYGIDPPTLPSPARHELEAKLRAQVQCDGRPKALAPMLWGVGEQAKLDFGWDAARVGSPVVSIPKGKHELRDVLGAVVAQTPVARYALEPGHGIWLYARGQHKPHPPSSATPWDRAVVRAYDIAPLLRRSAPEAILQEVRQRVGGRRFARGLPAAAVFPPTARLVVVDHPQGQERFAAAVQAMLEEALATPPEPDEES